MNSFIVIDSYCFYHSHPLTTPHPGSNRPVLAAEICFCKLLTFVTVQRVYVIGSVMLRRLRWLCVTF